MRRGTRLSIVVLLLTGCGVDERFPTEVVPMDEPTPPPEARGTFTVTLHVQRLSGGQVTPASGIEVRVDSVVARLEERPSVTGTTDAEGNAALEIDSYPGARYWATAVVDGVDFRPAPFASAPEAPVVITIAEVRDDPSALRIDRWLTSLSLSEDSVWVEQAFVLSATGDFVVAPGSDQTPPGMLFPMPSEATSISVLFPEDGEGVQVVPGGISVALPVGPWGVDLPAEPVIEVSFAMPLDGQALRFEQAVPLDVIDAILLVPLVTPFERFPTLDVDLSVPDCESGRLANLVCFFDVGAAVDLPFRAEVPRRLVGGGVGARGSTLVFHTDGRPTPNKPAGWVAGVGLVLILGSTVLGWGRLRRWGLAHRDDRRELVREQRQLLAKLNLAKNRFDSGHLSESELEAFELLARQRLDTLYERLDVPPDAGSPAESKASAATPRKTSRKPKS